MRIKVCLEKKEEGKIFLRDEKGRLLVLPSDILSEEYSIGDELEMFIQKKSEEKEGDLAKKILNEILVQEKN